VLPHLICVCHVVIRILSVTYSHVSDPHHHKTMWYPSSPSAHRTTRDLKVTCNNVVSVTHHLLHSRPLHTTPHHSTPLHTTSTFAHRTVRNVKSTCEYRFRMCVYSSRRFKRVLCIPTLLSQRLSLFKLQHSFVSTPLFKYATLLPGL